MKKILKKLLGKHYDTLIGLYLNVLGRISPKKLASIRYKMISGRHINWDNPKDLNEKINWLKFYSDTSMWSVLADKYSVREYIKAKGLETTLNDLYGVWDNPDNIDFNKLPNSFVLKSNNGCATVLIVRDKSKLDINQTRRLLKSWLKLRFGYTTAEPHYLKIKPLIIAEKLLYNKGEEKDSLTDYKVHCVNGQVAFILVCYDRTIGGSAKYQVLSADWEVIENSILNSYQGNKAIPKPELLHNLIEYSKILSSGFPQMRVDWYIVDNKIYFGEITMTSAGGYDGSYTQSFLDTIGELIILPKLK